MRVISRFQPQVWHHKIRDFANEGVQVNLAVSFTHPNNDLRSSIMRINRAFPIEKLFAAIEYYIETTNRRVTFGISCSMKSMMM